MSDEKAETWAVVELMGHVRLAGRLTEEERFGSKVGRLDIPNTDGGFTTQFFGGGSVYRITIVSEEAARIVAGKSTAAPVQPWELPKQLPVAETHSTAGTAGYSCHDDDYDDDYDDDRNDEF